MIQYPEIVTAEWVVSQLAKAGRTQRAMKDSGYTTNPKGISLEVASAAEPTYRHCPTPRQIAEMDEIFPDWLLFIPKEKAYIRIVVGLRAETRDDGSPVYNWRRMARIVHKSHEICRLWHAEGIDCIVSGLNRRLAVRPLANAA